VRLSQIIMRRTIVVLLSAACLLGGTMAVAADARLPGTRAQMRLYRSTRACCTDPTEFQFLDATVPGQTVLDIGPSSRLFDFHSGRSFFAALRLPAASGSYRIRVKSLLHGKGEDTRVFYPVVVLLNDNFIVTRISAISHLRLEPALATPGGASGLALTIRVDPAVAQERYLVVFTPAILLGEPPADRREGDVLTDTATDYFERKGDAAILPAAFGLLQVSLVPDTGDAAPGGDGS
jgi:hypothetical protein